MNEAIELHDSELVAATFSGGEAVVSLSPAYIHRSIGQPGTDAGSGLLQPATLTLSSVSLTSEPTRLPATISDGYLRIGSDLHTNIIPASGTFSGAIELSLTLSTAETLTIRARRISIQLHDEPSFVESFNQ